MKVVVLMGAQLTMGRRVGRRVVGLLVRKRELSTIRLVVINVAASAGLVRRVVGAAARGLATLASVALGQGGF